jgi:hypothetical protein
MVPVHRLVVVAETADQVAAVLDLVAVISVGTPEVAAVVVGVEVMEAAVVVMVVGVEVTVVAVEVTVVVEAHLVPGTEDPPGYSEN